MRTRCSPRVAMTVDVTSREPEVGGRPHTSITASRPLSKPGVDHPTAILDADVVGHDLRHGAQSRAAKYAEKRSVTWLAAFSSAAPAG